MPVNPTFGRALRDALREWERRHDPDTLSKREVAERVSALVGKTPPYSSQAASKWFAGNEPESWAVVFALARVLEVDPSELFGIRALPGRPEAVAPGTPGAVPHIGRAIMDTVGAERPARNITPGASPAAPAVPDGANRPAGKRRAR